MLPRLTRYLLLCLPALFFCTACEQYDANYTNLAAVAESNPNPKAIEGMWHRKWSDGLGENHTFSILFNPAKTGHYDSLATGLLVRSDRRGQFTWNYQGNGFWKTTLAPGTPAQKGLGAWLRHPTQWRVSGKYLLQETNVPTVNWYMVWERVEP